MLLYKSRAEQEVRSGEHIVNNGVPNRSFDATIPVLQLRTLEDPYLRLWRVKNRYFSTKSWSPFVFHPT